MASLGVSVMITLGCGTPPSAPTPSATPPTQPPPAPSGPEPSAAQRLAAFALLDAAKLHMGATTLPLNLTAENGKVMRANGSCDFGEGSQQGSLDGGSAPTPGTFLPTGSHTYVVSYRNCGVNSFFHDVYYMDGVASAAYNVAEWSNITATVSAESVRTQNSADALNDVTADGSAAWTRSSNQSTTYTPATGSRLVNNSTNNLATFGGGSYSFINNPGGQERRFDNLKVAVNGTEYTLNGSLVSIYTQPQATYSGEVRIISDGTLVARIYGNGVGGPKVEVLVPLVPL